MSDKKSSKSTNWGCSSIIFTIIIIVAAILIAWRCSFDVPPGHVAVLMDEVGGSGDGLRSEVLREGLHFYNPLTTDYFAVNTTEQTLTFEPLRSQSDEWAYSSRKSAQVQAGATDYWRLDRGRDLSEAEIRERNAEMRQPTLPIRTKTSDGEDVELEATLVFHVAEENAPQLIRFIGMEDAQKLLELYLIPAARSAIRSVFGELDSVAFFNSTERVAKSDQCRIALNELFGAAGVTVESFSLDQFTFDREFHNYLQDVKILNQRLASVDDQREATLEERKQELEQAKANARLSSAAAERKIYAAKADAELSLERMKQRAEMLRLRLRREADLVREKALAISGPGGEASLQMELAKALEGKPIVILPEGMDSGAGLEELLRATSAPQAVGP
ncbi:MAG: hypothetical protein JW941_05160 [Candidatus Coatesbacteria bacterium]|nr:hypothetical protein [Candidatus Coatesbacteria bacterium]